MDLSAGVSILGLDLRSTLIAAGVACLVFGVVLLILFKPRLVAIWRWTLGALRWLIVHGLWVAFTGALVYLAVRVERKELDPDTAAVTAGLLAAAGAVIALGTPGGKRLLGRVGKASIGPFAFEFVSEARDAADQWIEAKPKGGSKEGTPDLESLLVLRLRLENKLSSIAKRLLAGENEAATYVTVGGLLEEGLLTEKEAHTATRVLTLRDAELNAIDPGEKKVFLESAKKVVDNMRASVHFGRVKRLLKDEGWTVLELPRGRARPDLWAEKKNQRYRIVPRYVTAKKSKNLAAQVKRLQRGRANIPRVKKRLIVIPDYSRSQVTDATTNPRVVKFENLVEAMA